jgi:hypothetical protein
MSNSTDKPFIGERPPAIDYALWGDRMVGDAPALVGEDDERGPKPVAVQLDAQDIGRMAAEGYSPYSFNQFILEKLKFAGAPIEGVLRLRCTQGAVARLKPDLAQGPVFKYVWLPPAYVAGLAEFQKQRAAQGFLA